MINLFMILGLFVVVSGIVMADSDDLGSDKNQDTNLTFASKRGPAPIQFVALENKQNITDLEEVHTGLQYVIKTNTLESDTYLYVFNISPNKKLKVLFPSKEIDVKNPLVRGNKYTIPSEDSDEIFEFDSKKGIEIMYAITSKKPVRKLEYYARMAEKKKNYYASKKIKRYLESFGAPGKSVAQHYSKLVFIHKATAKEEVSKKLLKRAEKESGSKK